ncbi:MAG: Gfo/Idh/MocA family oxidoreductase, partial [Gemmatimonadetes bacterium]|nr:Gfo/Idh/MocA family oxidoreductase [Gemmatimonadota bacterium]
MSKSKGHRVLLVGAGGVGRKRAAALDACKHSSLVAVCDVDVTAAGTLANQYGAEACTDWSSAVSEVNADLVIVSTTHDVLSAVSVASLEAGRHVLCEKPLGRNREEVAAAVTAAASAGKVLRAGYNHRFHPAISGLQAAASEGRLGRLISIRGRYGHGGRPGYDREWRADPAVSGGGELLDQGAHLLDLCLWLLGGFDSAVAHTQTAFWDMEVEDNAFALLRTADGQVASLHVSWTQWRNLFSLEVFGENGYAIAEGLGGSYGPERLTIGHRRPEGGVPVEHCQTFGTADATVDA